MYNVNFVVQYFLFSPRNIITVLSSYDVSRNSRNFCPTCLLWDIYFEVTIGSSIWGCKLVEGAGQRRSVGLIGRCRSTSELLIAVPVGDSELLYVGVPLSVSGR